MVLLLLLSSVQCLAALRAPETARRRSVLVAAATTAAARAWPAAALSREEYEAIARRAKDNSLTTDNVIIRAIRDDLLDPERDFRQRKLEGDDCRVLESIVKIDNKAADEVRTGTEQLLKLKSAAMSAPSGTLGDREARALSDSYTFGRSLEERIRERASMINVRLNMDCGGR